MSRKRASILAILAAVCLVCMSAGASAQASILNASPQGQEIIAKHAFRPRDESVLQKLEGRFPAIKTFSVEQALGSWAEVQAKHFADGAIYDQIVVKR